MTSTMMNYSQNLQKNLKKSDTEPLNHGDQNENVNDQPKYDRRLSKRSAPVDADWRRRASNQFIDGNNYSN